MTDIDTGSDKIIDAALPLRVHEIVANGGHTIKVPKTVIVHFFKTVHRDEEAEGGYAVLFVERRWMKVFADSRDFQCNRFKVDPAHICILPQDPLPDAAAYSEFTKFTSSDWELIKECNVTVTQHKHRFVPALGAEPYRTPAYTMTRTTKNGKVMQQRPVIHKGLGGFGKHEWPHTKRRWQADKTAKDWFKIQGESYEDYEEWLAWKPTPRKRAESSAAGSQVAPQDALMDLVDTN